MGLRIAIGSDHRGVRVKGLIVEQLRGLGHDVVDMGPEETAPVDYPVYASKVAGAVSRSEADRGILICGTGLGMSIAANKFRGVRAVTCHDDVTAEASRRHNNANVMCLSADMLGERLLSRIVDLWVRTDFEAGRHQRRLDQIAEIEAEQGTSPEGGSCCG
ncbi:MAG: ribose 5-phosphate isomerase B [Planctomycetota bacterium]|nr:MAG: ribose 5-phosphate isomerase B [Planctomycetota bacterium]